MLLTKELYWHLGHGKVAFIKVRKFHSSFGTIQMQPFQTPNYELEPSDIKRVNLGPCARDPNWLAQFLGAMVQHSPVDLGYAVGLGGHLDVQFHGSPPPLPLPPSQPSSPSQPPPALILDYVYDVATFKAWRSRQGGEVHTVMRNYCDQQYMQIFPLLLQVDDSDDSDTSDNELVADNNDLDRSLGAPLRRGDTIVAAMDELNLVLMYHRGITPQEAAIRRKKRMWEEELMAQEASWRKVMKWMKTTAVSDSLWWPLWFRMLYTCFPFPLAILDTVRTIVAQCILLLPYYCNKGAG